MGIGSARIGDVGTGICCCHSDPTCQARTGIIVEGSSTVFADGLGMAGIGNVVKAEPCGHTGILVSGSTTVFREGIGASTIGSPFGSGCFSGIIVSGASTVFVGG